MSAPFGPDRLQGVAVQQLRGLFPRVDPGLAHFVWRVVERNITAPARDRCYVIDALVDYAIELTELGQVQSAVEIAELARVAQLAALGNRSALALFGVGAEQPSRVDPALLRVVRRVIDDIGLSVDAVLLLADALREAAGELRLAERPAQAAEIEGLARLVADVADRQLRQ